MRFDQSYYESVINQYNYSPLDFSKINFNLPGIDSRQLETKWLCHNDGDIFADRLASGKKSIVTTGIGLSGAPHLGTISQILRAIFLQQKGLLVQFVLGDLDSYNARNQPLDRLSSLEGKYREFILKLGFDPNKGILRNQKNRLDVLLTSYIIANRIEDVDFNDTEEDLQKIYKKSGIYPDMTFPVKLSILLMTADFIHLGLEEGFENELIMLGLEEHLYVHLAKKVSSRLNLNFHIGSIYSKVIKGFNNHPKMSKSIPGSGITADMNAEEIRKLIVFGEGDYLTPEDSVVYQMMCAVSYYTPDQLQTFYELCKNRDAKWLKCKEEYAEVVIDICSKWPKD